MAYPELLTQIKSLVDAYKKFVINPDVQIKKSSHKIHRKEAKKLTSNIEEQRTTYIQTHPDAAEKNAAEVAIAISLETHQKELAKNGKTTEYADEFIKQLRAYTDANPRQLPLDTVDEFVQLANEIEEARVTFNLIGHHLKTLESQKNKTAVGSSAQQQKKIAKANYQFFATQIDVLALKIGELTGKFVLLRKTICDALQMASPKRLSDKISHHELWQKLEVHAASCGFEKRTESTSTLVTATSTSDSVADTVPVADAPIIKPHSPIDLANFLNGIIKRIDSHFLRLIFETCEKHDDSILSPEMASLQEDWELLKNLAKTLNASHVDAITHIADKLQNYLANVEQTLHTCMRTSIDERSEAFLIFNQQIAELAIALKAENIKNPDYSHLIQIQTKIEEITIALFNKVVKPLSPLLNAPPVPPRRRPVATAVCTPQTVSDVASLEIAMSPTDASTATTTTSSAPQKAPLEGGLFNPVVRRALPPIPSAGRAAPLPPPRSQPAASIDDQQTAGHGSAPSPLHR